MSAACRGHVPSEVVGVTAYGHCGVCHRDFMGDRAFDEHRIGPHGSGRRCIDPANDPRTSTARRPEPWWQDDKGRWHKGYRLGHQGALDAFGR